MTSFNQNFSTFLILLVFASSYFLFSKGVNDSFYFDDHVNLNALELVQGSSASQIIDRYVLANGSGPLGRPVSMASFLLNDNSWPSNAEGFKRTNIKIHILVGLLVFWLSYLILAAKQYRHPALLAAVIGLFWLLNPLHLSTVYYPVQRMTQLSALFSISAIIIYLKGRMDQGNNSVFRSGLYFLGVSVCCLAAVLSKENAALLPLLLLTIEGFVGSQLRWNHWPKRRIIVSFLTIFSVSIVGYIVYKGLSSGFLEKFDRRDFSPYERLLTQLEVVLYYLKELIIPSLYTPGIYYDHWLPVRSSGQVIVHFLLFVGLVLGSIFLYFRGYLTGLAGLFFLSGHLIESTVLNLELVFEHRNYLPSVFLGFVLVDIYSALKAGAGVRVLVLVVPIIVVSIVTYERSTLWRDRVVHSLYLAQASPHSIRSQVELHNALLSQGMLGEAQEHLDLAVQNNPDSLYLELHSVLLACMLNRDDSKAAEKLVHIASGVPFDGRQILGYRKLMNYLEGNRCSLVNPSLVDRLLRAHLVNDMIKRTNDASLDVLYSLAGRFYALYPELTRQAVNIDEAVANDPEYVMSVAASLASSGQLKKALRLSHRAENLLKQRGELSPDENKLINNILEFQNIVRSDISNEKRLK